MQRLFLWILTLLVTLGVVACGGSGRNPTNSTGGNTPWMITAAGGTFDSGTGTTSVRLTVPAGAVAANTNVTATRLTTAQNGPAGTTYVPNSGWSFTPATFTNPATLRIAFAPTAVPEAAHASIKIYRRADGQAAWVEVPTTVDEVSHTASATITGFSSYGLFYTSGTGWNWTAAGGTFTSGRLTVTLPAGAVNAPTEVQPRATPTPFDPPAGWSPVINGSFDLGSDNPELITTLPFTVEISYEATSVAPHKRSQLKIFHKENASADWVQLPTTANEAHFTASASSNMLGTFALHYPIADPTNIYHVEIQNIPTTNDNNVDVYGTTETGETPLFHAVKTVGRRIEPASFRMDQTNFLEIKFNGIHEGGIYGFNPTTNVSSFILDISPDTRWEYEGMYPTRSTRHAAGDVVALATNEFNENDMISRDRIVVYRPGHAPRVLESIDRHPSHAPKIFRAMDINVAGDVLAWTPEGLVIYEGSSRRVLAGPDSIPTQARFSPSGDHVLFLSNAVSGTSWNTVPTSGGSVTPIAGLGFDDLARWDTSDADLLVATGATRQLRRLSLTTGTFTVLGTAGARTNAQFVDIAPR